MRRQHDRSQAISGRLQVFRRGFAGALVGDDIIGDLLPFIQAVQTGPFDRADMNEHIGAAGVRLKEPEPFRRIEPFHCARRHGALLSNKRTTQVCQGGRLAQRFLAQRFRRSLTDLPDEKVSFFDAAILIFSPLAGLRPSRSGVALTLNFPNPGSDTSAPLAAASTMSFRKSSTIDLACTLLTPCASASFATSSVVFIGGFLAIRFGASMAWPYRHVIIA